MNECIFCKIVNKELPSNIIYEDDYTLAFLDIFPIKEGHTLIIPKQHFSGLKDLDEEISKYLMPVAIKICNALYKPPFNADGVNLLLSDGRAAGQEIFHVHLHVIPRYENDNIKLGAPRSRPSQEKLKNIAEKLRNLI